jgi:hypothetical protein
MPGFRYGHSGTSSGHHHLQYAAVHESFDLISIFFCMLNGLAYLVFDQELFLESMYCNILMVGSCFNLLFISMWFCQNMTTDSVPGESRVKSLMCSLVGNCNKKMD